MATIEVSDKTKRDIEDLIELGVHVYGGEPMTEEQVIAEALQMLKHGDRNLAREREAGAIARLWGEVCGGD